MRRSGSHSTTGLRMTWAATIRMPIVTRSPACGGRPAGADRARFTEPEPSISTWRAGSARRAKIRSAGAWITRSTETTSRSSLMAAHRCVVRAASPEELLRHAVVQVRVDGLQLADGLLQRHPHDLPGLQRHHLAERTGVHRVDGG